MAAFLTDAPGNATFIGYTQCACGPFSCPTACNCACHHNVGAWTITVEHTGSTSSFVLPPRDDDSREWFPPVHLCEADEARPRSLYHVAHHREWREWAHARRHHRHDRAPPILSGTQ
jgi:hypothetical protein